MAHRLFAETFGTFWLVFCGCGSAVLSAAFPQYGIGFAGVALAFGLTVLTMAYALGHVSGAHFNPAVTIGLWAGGRVPGRDVAPYITAQVIGGIVASFVLLQIASGSPDYVLATNGLASNGFGEHSPGGFSMMSALTIEILLTGGFVIVILGATDARAPAGFAPLAIGMALTLVHLVSIPVTNASVNPARSTGPALVEGGIALQQLWFFWVYPITGALIAGFTWRALSKD
ncbi:aquaporin Z [Polymorphobacter arshaanensis]|uniref:Aquaporin Z n=1 Tax=Glacieibacterium arshaanense TaxID=2511025 RepID=A0A4Y9ESP7_9SPHN|nr:aquaporin Z [Polymorphobacter arshaanensis]